MNAKERFDALNQIENEVVGLKVSPLYNFRIKNKFFPVIGEGSLFSKIMFIGEAPGKKEAVMGRPFMGASGKFLNELLDEVGIKREKIYITSIVKDRPPENRDPTPSEIELYGPFLDRQIDIIQPKIIATLGRFSMVYIMKKFKFELPIEPISQAHGKSYTAYASYGKIQILPFYHPAVALYKGSMRKILKKDFEIFKKI